MKNLKEIAEIISYLQINEIKVWVENDFLEYEAPVGTITEDLITILKDNKTELIKFLSTENQINRLERIESIQLEESYELSNAQRRLWIIDQLEDKSIAYNMPAAFILEGEFNSDVFRQAYSFMIERHESLRTVFTVENGEPKQKILKNPDYNIEIVDLRDSPNVENEARVLAEKDLKTPFNLVVGPLVRFTILRLEDVKFLLLFNMHHIISDGWSMNIFIREFLVSYKSFNGGSAPELPHLRIHYKDYSAWQNDLLKSSVMVNQREFWLDKLSGDLPVLDLPADNTRPVTQTFNGKTIGFILTGEINRALNDLCLENKTSLFMMLQALVKVLFHRYTGQEDIILGSPIAGRVHGDLENQIGFYVNTLSLRDTIESNLTFKEFLASVKKTCTDAFDNQDYPFDRLVEDLDVKRDLSRSPLFDVMVVLQNNETTTVEFDGLNLSPYKTEITVSKFDLTFYFYETGEGLFCSIEYNMDIYSVDRINRMGKHLKTLISSVLENPESRIKDLEIIPTEEKNQLLNVFNDTKTDYPADKTIVQLFEEQVEKTPDSIAVVFEEVEFTYRELNERCNKLSRFLVEKGISRNCKVAIMIDRSFEMIISVIAVIKAGGVYVPFEPFYPVKRIQNIINDLNISLIISESKFIKKITEIQWNSVGLSHVLCIDIDEENILIEEVDKDNITQLWDFISEKSTDRITEGGFISIYSGEPFSGSDVDEYVERVSSLTEKYLDKDKKVLEIGCGSGLIIEQIAGNVKEYIALDPSAATIEKVSSRSGKNVKTIVGYAHEVADICLPESLDLIIIASTIQFFPGYAYFEDIIKKCLSLLKKDGAIIIADIMDGERKDEYQNSIESYRVLHEVDSNIKQNIDSELFFDKVYFNDLVSKIDSIGSIKINSRDIGFNNELKYRFDVIIEKSVKKNESRSVRRFLWTNYHLDKFSNKNLDVKIYTQDLVYIIYTSGSTGMPKGVAVQHKPVVNLINWVNKEFNIGGNDKLLFVTSLCFDLSVYDIFGMLSAGGAIRIATLEDNQNPEKLLNILKNENITFWDSAPAMLNMVSTIMDQEIYRGSSLRLIFLSGDWIPVSLPDKIRQSFPKSEVISLGGATEATVWSNYYRIDNVNSSWASIPYGKPIQNSQYYILDANLKPLPIGIPGDLYISGECLSLCYINDDELTSSKYIENPFQAGQRMYKTGDIARWFSDGNMEFLGRSDNQVKIRGFRIELGEIENVLNQIDFVDSAVVVAKEDHNREKYLVAYYLVNNDKLKIKEIENNRVASWQKVFQSYYSDVSYDTKLEFDLSGWLSSYTGSQIEPSQMMEWVNSTVDRIQLTRPKKIYEIGCGSGLLLFRLAPSCHSYIGVDYSEEIISKVEKVINSKEDIKNKSKVYYRPADDFTGISNRSLDTIVVNSVAQYFPNIEYLTGVIEKSINAIEKGGVLFLGDLRNYNLFELFHTSVNIFQEDEYIEVDKLIQKINRTMEQETELLVSPEYFYYLKKQISRISHVDIRLKKGEANNEMTKFRYDVFLHIEKSITEERIIDLSFEDIGFDVSLIPSILDKDDPDLLYVTGATNSRIERDYYEMLHLEDMNNNRELFITSTKQTEEKSIDSIEFEKISPPDYIVELLWAGNGKEQLFDVVYIKEKLLKGKYHGIIPNRDQEITIDYSVFNYANTPLTTTSKSLVLKKMKESLKQFFPNYMIPSFFIYMDKLPLTSNGKVDRKALPEVTGRISGEEEYVAPRSKIEKILVNIWRDVLSGHISPGIDDNYFELGGDSIKAIQIMARLSQEGLKGEIAFLFTSPTIREFAPLVKEETIIIDQSPVTGLVPLSPIQKWFFYDFECPKHHFNHAVMLEFKESVDEEKLKAIKQSTNKLIKHHDALRMGYKQTDGVTIQENRGEAELYFKDYDLRDEPDPSQKIEEIATSVQNSFNLENDTLVRFVFFSLKDGCRLLIVAHHLVIDGVSWRVLTSDLESGYRQSLMGNEIKLPLKTTSFKDWSEKLTAYAMSPRFKKEAMFWKDIDSRRKDIFPGIDITNKIEKSASSISLSKEDTEMLLSKTNQAFNTQINDILLTALTRAISKWSGETIIPIELESHGRSERFEDMDLSRTIGWFTSIYPVVLETTGSGDIGVDIISVKESLREIPDNGIGYGIYKYLTPDPSLDNDKESEILFNYLGQFDADMDTDLFGMASESTGKSVSSESHCTHKLNFNGMVALGQFSMTLESDVITKEVLDKIQNLFKGELISIIIYLIDRIQLVVDLDVENNDLANIVGEEIYI